MRTIIALCTLTLAAGAFFGWRAMQTPSRYGTFTGAPRVEVAAVLEHPRDFMGRTISVRGTVSQQCKTMGCYFYMPAGPKTLRIELEAIAMTAPRREGHEARVEGRVERHDDGYQIFATAVEFER